MSNRSARKAGRAGRPPLAPCLIAPAITLIVLLIAMALTGTFPFGDHPFVARDGVFQYVGLHGWYHQVLTGQDNLFYSFAKGLGGGTFPLFAYYLSSPVSLLAAFVQPKDMAAAFSAFMIIKLCLASFTCAVFLTRRLNVNLVRTKHTADGARRALEPAAVPILLLGTAYALTSWSFANGQNIMWIDGLIMLPLVALGVWRVASGKSPALLFASAAGVMLFNWYAAYMVCLFSIFYFFAELPGASREALTTTGNAAPQRKLLRRARVKAVLTYGATMVLAIMAGMVILLPVVLAQLAGGTVSDETVLSSSFFANATPLSIVDLAKSMLVGTRDFAGQGNPVKIPLAVLLAAMAALAVPAPRSLKVGMGAIIAALVASFLYKPLDMVWTGFVRADAFNPRYAFLLHFALTLCAAFAIDWLIRRVRSTRVDEDGAVNENTGATGPIPAAGPVPTAAAPAPRPRAPRIALAAFSAATLAGSLLICVQGLGLGGVHGFNSNSLSGYQDYMAALEDAANQLEELNQSQDGSPYRIGTAMGSVAGAMIPIPYQGTANGPMPKMMTTGQDMSLGISSPAHYSSTASGPVKQLLGHLGYCTLPGARGVTAYQDPLFVTDSLLGVRYVLDTQQPAGASQALFSINLPAPYGTAHAYQNTYALPVGYGVEADADNIEWTDDPFTNQRLWLQSLTGSSAANLYSPANVSQGTAATVDSAADGTCVAYTVTAATDGPLYLWVTNAPAPIAIYVDGQLVQSSRNYEFDTNVIYLGDLTAGDQISVTLRCDAGLDPQQCGIDAQTLNMDVATAALTSLQASPFDVQTMSDGRIQGTVDLKAGQKLMLTIPAEDGWAATVDGKPAQIQSVNGLICIDAGAGQHTVNLVYRTPGLKTGAMASAAGIIVAGVWMGACPAIRSRHPKRSSPSSSNAIRSV